MRRLPPSRDGDLGFQIAPMIDVVFVIMLFFMVMAGAVKVEHHLLSNLPGRSESESVEFVDEIILGVSSSGDVTLNDEPYGEPTDRLLTRLRPTLQRLKQNSDDAKSTCLVTLRADPRAPYRRVIDVMSALQAVGITNATFTLSEEAP